MTTARRFVCLIAVLTLAALATAPPLAHASFYCNPRDSELDTWVYYSDGTYTTVVGSCQNDCGECECYGSQSTWVLHHSSPVC